MKITDVVKKIKELKEIEGKSVLAWVGSGAAAEIKTIFHARRQRIEVSFIPLSYRTIATYQSFLNIYEKQPFISLMTFPSMLDISLNFILNGINCVKILPDAIYINKQDIRECIQRADERLVSTLLTYTLLLNGLHEATQKEVNEQLSQLEEISYMLFSKSVDVPVPSWASGIFLSFQIFRETGRWSAPHPIDEPYLLLLAWLAVARGESRYFDELTRRQEEAITQMQAGEPPASAVDAISKAVDIEALSDALKRHGLI